MASWVAQVRGANLGEAERVGRQEWGAEGGRVWLRGQQEGEGVTERPQRGERSGSERQPRGR